MALRSSDVGCALNVSDVGRNPAGVAGHAHRHWGEDFSSGALYVRGIAMFMLATSIVIASWAGYTFNNRANMLQ